MKEGILLLNKPAGKSAFYLVKVLRKKTSIQKIGHAGTLDPFATGLMIMLIGKTYTQKQSLFLNSHKEYAARIKLGQTTDSYDVTGTILFQSQEVPTLAEVESALSQFQGTIAQIPPMFSAKKKNGKRLYQIARMGKEIPRDPVLIEVQINLISYAYPFVDVYIRCSKGTYIRSIAHDLGMLLKTGAHLFSLERTKCGPFTLKDAISMTMLENPSFTLETHLKQ